MEKKTRTLIFVAVSLAVLAASSAFTEPFTCHGGSASGNASHLENEGIGRTLVSVWVEDYPCTFYWVAANRPKPGGTCTTVESGNVYVTVAADLDAFWNVSNEYYGSAYMICSEQGTGGQAWVGSESYCTGNCYDP